MCGLTGAILGLPYHASELSVERELGALARRNLVAGEAPFFLGCGAYRRRSDEFCEMKRLFVPDRFRGLGIGRKLCDALIDAICATGVPHA